MFARLLSEKMQASLGQPVVVVAKPGGGGAVMASQLKAAKPDGYTLGISVTITWAFNPYFYKETPYRAEDFTYVAVVADGKPAFFTRKDAPWTTLKDLVADAKTRNQPFSFVSLAPSVRLQINDIARKEGIKFRIVPAAGGSEALPMILGGHADFAFSGGFHHASAVAGKLKVLAFTDEVHQPDLPGVPTLKDLGYESFPQGYILIAGPKGIPADVLGKLSQAIEQALKNPAVKRAGSDMDAPVVYLPPAATEKEIKSQAAYFTRLIEADRKAETTEPKK
ncbi:MAG: tripartite tricarboxylate transporter substrate binding protein [Alphaproteobacteria bacterium]